MAAALTLFARHGYHGTTIRMLARMAGVSVGLIYAHFQSKGALLDEIFEERIAAVEQAFNQAERDSTGTDPVERLIDSRFVVLRKELDFWRISYLLRVQPPPVTELGNQVGEWDAVILDTLTRCLRTAGAPQPNVEAHVLLASIDGISQRYALQPDLYPLDDVTMRFIELYRRLRPSA